MARRIHFVGWWDVDIAAGGGVSGEIERDGMSENSHFYLKIICYIPFYSVGDGIKCYFIHVIFYICSNSPWNRTYRCD